FSQSPDARCGSIEPGSEPFIMLSVTAEAAVRIRSAVAPAVAAAVRVCGLCMRGPSSCGPPDAPLVSAAVAPRVSSACGRSLEPAGQDYWTVLRKAAY